MQQQSCSHAQGNCFFPVNKDEEEKEEKAEEVYGYGEQDGGGK